MMLVDAAYTEVHPWDTAMREQEHLQDDIQEVEGRSRAVLVYEPTLVPGLLQTADYARRVFSMFEPAYASLDIPGRRRRPARPAGRPLRPGPAVRVPPH